RSPRRWQPAPLPRRRGVRIIKPADLNGDHHRPGHVNRSGSQRARCQRQPLHRHGLVDQPPGGPPGKGQRGGDLSIGVLGGMRLPRRFLGHAPSNQLTRGRQLHRRPPGRQPPPRAQYPDQLIVPAQAPDPLRPSPTAGGRPPSRPPSHWPPPRPSSRTPNPPHGPSARPPAAPVRPAPRWPPGTPPTAAPPGQPAIPPPPPAGPRTDREPGP